MCDEDGEEVVIMINELSKAKRTCNILGLEARTLQILTVVKNGGKMQNASKSIMIANERQYR